MTQFGLPLNIKDISKTSPLDIVLKLLLKNNLKITRNQAELIFAAIDELGPSNIANSSLPLITLLYYKYVKKAKKKGSKNSLLSTCIY
jgi:hypothetical protein